MVLHPTAATTRGCPLCVRPHCRRSQRFSSPQRTSDLAHCPHNSRIAFVTVFGMPSMLVTEMRRAILTLLASSALLLALLPTSSVSAFSTSQYDVEWTDPSDLETESMPLGNGDLAMQSWVERGTGDLLYYAQPSTSWEENGQLLKLIRGRLHLAVNASTSPSPTSSPDSSVPSSLDAPLIDNFKQHLHLLNMSQTITYTLSSIDVSITIWVDRYRPAIHFNVFTSVPVNATVSIEMWRTTPTSMGWWSWGYYCDGDITNVETDTFVSSGLGLAPSSAGELLWYHRNDHQAEADRTYLHALKLQGLEGLGLEEKDVLRNRTFGGFVTTHDATGKRWGSATVLSNPGDYVLLAGVSTLAPLTDVSFDLYTVTATTGQCGRVPGSVPEAGGADVGRGCDGSLAGA